jgi:hypothetical protein
MCRQMSSQMCRQQRASTWRVFVASVQGMHDVLGRASLVRVAVTHDRLEGNMGLLQAVYYICGQIFPGYCWQIIV